MKEAVKLHMVYISSDNDRHLPLKYTCQHFTWSYL